MASYYTHIMNVSTQNMKKNHLLFFIMKY